MFTQSLGCVGTNTLNTVTPNSPTKPLNKPCFHRQLAELHIPAKHYVQKSAMLSPDDSKFLFQQKFEDFHYSYQSGETQILPNYVSSNLSNASTAIVSPAFSTRLGDVHFNGLKTLRTFPIALAASVPVKTFSWPSF